MSQLFLFKLILFACTLLIQTPSKCLLPFAEADKTSALAFFSTLEQRKKRIEELEKQRTIFKKRAETENIILTKTLTKIKLDINNVQQLLRKFTEEKSNEIDYLNKKLMLLNDRKQNISKTQELWVNGAEFLEKDIKLNKEIIDFLQTKKEDLKPVYSWREFREAQMRASEFVVKIDSAKSKRNDLTKQRDAEREKVVTLLKQLEVKGRERDKVVAGTHSDGSSYSIKQDADILQEEINTLEEHIQLARLTIDILNLESKLQDDEIDFLHLRLNELRLTLNFIEKRLVLDYSDVDVARAEWSNEAQKTLQIKEDLDLTAEPKKDEKVYVGAELDRIRSEVSALKAAGKKDDATTKQLSSLLHKLETKFAVLEKELTLIEAKKALAEMSVNIKELQFHMVELQQRLRRPFEKQDLVQLFTNFKTQKEYALSVLKSLKERNDAIGKLLIESNRSIESLQARELKIKEREDTIFKDKKITFEETLKNTQDAKKNLHQQIFLTQQYLGVNSDLINNQEKIINHYNLILEDLEVRLKTMSIWKRSAKAITFAEFTSALSETDILLKRMFWDTPNHLSPMVIAKALKDWIVYDFYLVLLFVMLFAFSFIGTRLLFKAAHHRKVSQLAKTHPAQRVFFYYNITLACIDFALENFALLFTWFFLYLHILFKFSYIFASLKRFGTPFYIAAFFIFSIPVLVYLSHELLSALKDLNKKLSYLFFAEKIQDRFIILLSTFFYSTAVLIPFRSALLVYSQTPLQIATVILAAYSLILIIILALFVSKEYVLTVIPNKYLFLIFIKRLIDRHYYPVFFFVIMLLILSNPYIGYSNLAWYLAFVVPSSILVISAIFSLHHYIRKYSVFLFMKEEEDEISDKFEYAKTYYGFFIIFSFVVLLLVAFLLVSRLWGYYYSPADIWKLLSEDWIIKIDGTTPLGFVQFATLALFITSGFLLSSLICRFVLNKLFDVLRTEPGTQNTFTRIFHYAIVGFAIMLGFAAIKLTQFIFWVGGFLFIGIGWALKDLVVDFVAGFFVLIERPIEIGNYISIDTIEGTVRKIAARSTTITTGRNLSVIVPNKDLVTKQIINWGHGRFAIGIELYVRVEHESDPELVRKVITSVLQSNPLILRVPNIVVRLEGFEESALYFLARGFISARRVKDQFDIASALRIELIKAFREHGVALAQPQRVVHMASDKEGEIKPPSPLEIKFDRP